MLASQRHEQRCVISLDPARQPLAQCLGNPLLYEGLERGIQLVLRRHKDQHHILHGLHQIPANPLKICLLQTLTLASGTPKDDSDIQHRTDLEVVDSLGCSDLPANVPYTIVRPGIY